MVYFYEVRFGRKKENYLGHVINFSVLSDDYEDEYSVTNKGELFRIIATIIDIIRDFHSLHPFTDTYEFSGEFKTGEEHEFSIRSKLYLRYARRALAKHWRIQISGNKISILKIE